jgi:hypothetical protein
MQLIKNSPYKILSIIGGQHSCGLVYYENGEIKVVLEEERLIRHTLCFSILFFWVR